MEAKTYRVVPHSSDDDDRSYRSRDEVEQWKKRDPILQFRHYLEGAGMLTAALLDEYDAKAAAEAEDAVKAAEEAPYPDASEGMYPVYAEDVRR